jgi:hypothetical protein
VGLTLRVVRSRSRSPSRVSNSRIRPLSAACERCMACAASEKEPVSSTAMKARSWRSVTLLLMDGLQQIRKPDQSVGKYILCDKAATPIVPS